MANKKFLLGILAFMLVFGVMSLVVSCGDDEPSRTNASKLGDDASLAQAKAKLQELLGKSDIHRNYKTEINQKLTELNALNDTTWASQKTTFISQINVMVDAYNSGQLEYDN